MYKSSTVVKMNSDLPSLTEFEENSPIKFITMLVLVLGEVFPRYRDVEDWRDVILRKGAEGWFGDLRVES